MWSPESLYIFICALVLRLLIKDCFLELAKKQPAAWYCARCRNCPIADRSSTGRRAANFSGEETRTLQSLSGIKTYGQGVGDP
jgi:hypothetical protein